MKRTMPATHEDERQSKLVIQWDDDGEEAAKTRVFLQHAEAEREAAEAEVFSEREKAEREAAEAQVLLECEKAEREAEIDEEEAAKTQIAAATKEFLEYERTHRVPKDREDLAVFIPVDGMIREAAFATELREFVAEHRSSGCPTARLVDQIAVHALEMIRLRQRYQTEEQPQIADRALVIRAIKRATRAEGVSVADLSTLVPLAISAENLRSALVYLENEGEIYTTCDAEHYTAL